MQQLTSQPQPKMYPNIPPRPTTNTNDRLTIVLITALILFAIAGLLSGFAIGAINRQPHAQTGGNVHNTQQNKPTVPSKTGSTQTTATPTITSLGCPKADVFTSPETADGQTIFTASAFATSGGTCAGTQLNVSGITFKLWLTKRITSLTFPENAKAMLDTINSPITGKAKNGDTIQDLQAIQFTTAQVQQSNTQGRVTWKYTLPTALKSGLYDIVVLVDWQGKLYNWSWYDITINKP